jgi:hypothetical protein
MGVTMNPTAKFTLGRIGLFLLVALALWPVPVSLLVKLMIAVIASTILQFVVLRRWRAEMIDYIDQSVGRRRQEREKLRSALAGDDPSTGDDAPAPGRKGRPSR